MTSESRDKFEPFREEDVHGLNYFNKLEPMRDRLRDVASARDKTGNRQLFMNQQRKRDAPEGPRHT
jgi:hypothetical protein